MKEVMFVGRDEELRELKQRYDSDDTEIICVLGRRRVGKSQLIFNSHKDFDGVIISFECSDVGYHNNLLAIENLIKTTFDNNYLHFASLYDVLMFLQQEASKRKILFVIDEYPYMRNGKETDSEIKRAIDDFDKIKNKNPLKFIMCGSSVQVMEVLDDASMPLHGRFDKIIRLFPLDYLYSSLLYKSVSNDDKVKYYSILGGTPYYIKQIKPELSFEDNIIDLFLSSNALLKTELENQINGEINKVEKATYILNIIRDKLVSYTDIVQLFKSSFPNGEIDYPLSKLLEMRVIEKIFIKQDNGKNKPYYRIIDNSFIFYYIFLAQPFANRILFSDKDYYQTFIKNKLLYDYIPHMFEKIGYQFVAIMNRKNKLPYKLTDLFTYIINDKETRKNYQFDVVGETNGGLINFECKYQDNLIKKNEVYLERRQTELANSNFLDTIFISKSEVEDAKMVFYLSDIYNDELLLN